LLGTGVVYGWKESCRISTKTLGVIVPMLDSIIGSPLFTGLPRASLQAKR